MPKFRCTYWSDQPRPCCPACSGNSQRSSDQIRSGGRKSPVPHGQRYMRSSPTSSIAPRAALLLIAAVVGLPARRVYALTGSTP